MGLAQLARAALSRAGYVLWKREFIRYGVDPWLDVRRLSNAWGIHIATAFDVGAHEGETRRELAAEFPGIETHSFEPHPATFERLRLNSSSKGGVYRLALSDRAGKATFYDYSPSGQGSTMNSLVPDAGFALHSGHPATQIEVDCDTVDHFCESRGIRRLDLLKVDVEGHDLAVLKGADGMLREGGVRFVYAEFNDLFDREGVSGGSVVPIAEFLGRLGFHYVAAYTDRVEAQPLWVSANVLFARQPNERPSKKRAAPERRP